ncbi:MAG: SGNH/GDSL hydrolase family protein [Treponema sp.]|jgi:lysophospholipase L1-like esterase|nr:SGNH/GDSL hydrolase family protein [Treponema sp.]
MIADSVHYLDAILDAMAVKWPDNRTINIVCHGHSVPAGYFATPYVNTLEAYPAQLLRFITERFPFAVVNVIVTAIGGESSPAGAERFERDVLCHRPDLVTVDYGLNDRGIGLAEAEKAWRFMIETALNRGCKVILLTPTWDQTYFAGGEGWKQLADHAAQIRILADKYEVGLADSFAAFSKHVHQHEDLVGLLSHVNHPSAKGHRLVAEALGGFFPPR